MDDPSRVARLLLESATTLAHATNARAILVSLEALPEVEAVPKRVILVARSAEEQVRAAALAGEARTITVPNVELDRLGQVKLAAIIALSRRMIDLEDGVIFLAGPFRSLIDTLVVMTMGSEYELFDTTQQPGIDEHIKRAVFYRVLDIALSLGEHGREGRRSGALFVIGDVKQVTEQSEQMILNPFKGHDEKSRNVLDDSMTETVKEFSSIDGAFIIRGNGVIETAGARLKGGMSDGVPLGLGARHAAAAGITAYTRSVSITVSSSDGVVRVWRAGKLVASFQPSV